MTSGFLFFLCKRIITMFIVLFSVLVLTISLLGPTMDDVIKTTVFMKNMNDFVRVNELYAKQFQEPYPARSAVEAARLPKDALVEVEVIARKQ